MHGCKLAWRDDGNIGPSAVYQLSVKHLSLPMFWPEVIRHTAATDWENYLARNLLPLPLGPHLTEDDMHRMIHLILG